MNQPQIPQVPNHDGKPQDGRSYVWGDPGPAIGTIVSISSSFGVVQLPSCTFIGTEGAAAFRHDGAQQLARFVDAPFAMEVPVSIESDPAKSITAWSLHDAWYREVFRTTDAPFGRAVERQHAKFWVPRLLEQLEAQPPLKMWCAQPRYVALSKESVEVQQAVRRDVVTPQEITVLFENGDLVLHADAFFEARFLGEETPNTTILLLLLKVLGASTNR